MLSQALRFLILHTRTGPRAKRSKVVEPQYTLVPTSAYDEHSTRSNKGKNRASPTQAVSSMLSTEQDITRHGSKLVSLELVEQEAAGMDQDDDTVPELSVQYVDDDDEESRRFDSTTPAPTSFYLVTNRHSPSRSRSVEDHSNFFEDSNLRSDYNYESDEERVRAIEAAEARDSAEAVRILEEQRRESQRRVTEAFVPSPVPARGVSNALTSSSKNVNDNGLARRFGKGPEASRLREVNEEDNDVQDLDRNDRDVIGVERWMIGKRVGAFARPAWKRMQSVWPSASGFRLITAGKVFFAILLACMVISAIS